MDPERAMKFYKELLGWRFTKWDGPLDYWLIHTGPEAAPGIDGGLMRRRGGPPVEGAALNAFGCTVETPNVDDLVSRVPALGGHIVVPKVAVPGVGWLAYAKDPEGNVFGFMQVDPTAE
jgi:predicted enzyme related to lactoylglutathione lyase